MLQETHVASGLSTATTTHHGGLDSVAPPVTSGAGLVVNHRKEGLLQPVGEEATG